MSFLTIGALAVVVFVAGPIAAHLFRRRRAEEHRFAATKLVAPTPPNTRRRSAIEDRSLLAVRALSVVALAVLGATPFVRCSRLSVARTTGASVALAIVLDDSLSMRVKTSSGRTRFDRAVDAARDLVRGAREGDAVALVLAGAPARVALATTTDLKAALAAIDAAEPSDRATELDGALELGRDLVKSLAQPDKRIVLLSDLADGHTQASPLTDASGSVRVWAPLPELAEALADCAVIRADRSGDRVIVHVACTPEAPGTRSQAEGRSLEILAGKRVVATTKLSGRTRLEDVRIELPPHTEASLEARLAGSDALAEDDSAPVVESGGALAVATVIDAAASRVETGGPPPVEQAFASLELDASLRPLASIPENAADLAPYAALIVDDPPGFTPEVRRSLGAWVERGGVVLLTLGPRAASAPLGAGFDPLVPGSLRWSTDKRVRGIDPASAPTFGSAASGFIDLAPRGRTLLDVSATAGSDMLARWSDGAAFAFRRPSRRGAVVVVTLPMSVEESDLALRPAFLLLLDRFVGFARARGGARRIEVGETWTFDGYANVSIGRIDVHEARPVPLVIDSSGGLRRATPAQAGLYELHLDADRSMRTAEIAEREIDLRPRRVEQSLPQASLGGVAGAEDISSEVALVVLALFALEIAMRAFVSVRVRPVPNST